MVESLYYKTLPSDHGCGNITIDSICDGSSTVGGSMTSVLVVGSLVVGGATTGSTNVLGSGKDDKDVGWASDMSFYSIMFAYWFLPFLTENATNRKLTLPYSLLSFWLKLSYHNVSKIK